MTSSNREFDSAVSDFNGIVCSSIEQAISDLLSLSVMESVYAFLRDKHDLTRDEVPYRLETFFSVLADVFGEKAALTMGRTAARILYAHLGMRFVDKTGFTLSDYVAEAKENLQTNHP